MEGHLNALCLCKSERSPSSVVVLKTDMRMVYLWHWMSVSASTFGRIAINEIWVKLDNNKNKNKNTNAFLKFTFTENTFSFLDFFFF